ncbi:MAG: cation:proton antiporter [Tannerella sp.]|jgi:CPA2 family monovalent cation:H+ antiporter-2|nr:cation:proton antiporter [Tannerella sp.]
MVHLPDFIGDLALILIAAGVATILFKFLKQPVVLGYIVAGFVAGSAVPWLPTIADMENVKIWAEIGVIFLLFALGLEFSFKKLIAVGNTATLATLINMGAMIVIGYMVGRMLGWPAMDSVFLGGMLSMSSTTIIIKAFNDMSLQRQKFAGIVFGMLIVEDLAAIVMMVLLSTVAVSHRIEGVELLENLVRLLFFVLIWFIVGIYVIPTLLKKVKKYLNDETLIIVATGLCLGMVLFASKVGFSAALGAFIMGSILAETIRAKQIEHLIEPVKNLFGAVFFVSVGMMIEPSVIGRHIGLILFLTAVVLTGRVVFATLGVLASGEGLKVALQSGFSLAQIGEFSFIIATLGINLKVIGPSLYPVIVAVSIITTFTTPYFIGMATPVYRFIEKRLPSAWRKIIDGYASSGLKTVNRQNTWNRLLKHVLLFTTSYASIALAIVLAGKHLLIPLLAQNLPGFWGRLLSATLLLLLMAPFLRAILMKKNRSDEFKSLWNDSHFNRGVLVSLLILKAGVCCVLILMVLVPLFPRYTLEMLIVSMMFMGIIIFFEGFKRQSRRIEARFMENLNQKERLAEQQAAIHPQVAHTLLSKKIHLEEIEISPQSPRIGKTLRELDFRGKLKLNIVTIVRGNRKINIPDANERLYPYDKLIVAGSDENIQKFVKDLEARNQEFEADDEAQPHIVLSQYVVETHSPLAGKSLGETNLQQKTECMIISIDREGTAWAGIPASFVFREGDTLLLAGEKTKLDAFETALSSSLTQAGSNSIDNR